MCSSDLFIQDRDRIVIDVSGDDACRAFVVGILLCRRMSICKNCVLCAYKKMKDRNNNIISGSAALIVG